MHNKLLWKRKLYYLIGNSAENVINLISKYSPFDTQSAIEMHFAWSLFSFLWYIHWCVKWVAGKMSISNNNPSNMAANNQSLAAEGVVERGGFVSIQPVFIYIYSNTSICSHTTQLYWTVKLNRMLLFTTLDASCCAMPAKIHWMKVHKINCRVHQRTRQRAHIKTMNILPSVSRRWTKWESELFYHSLKDCDYEIYLCHFQRKLILWCNFNCGQ